MSDTTKGHGLTNTYIIVHSTLYGIGHGTGHDMVHGVVQDMVYDIMVHGTYMVHTWYST